MIFFSCFYSFLDRMKEMTPDSLGQKKVEWEK